MAKTTCINDIEDLIEDVYKKDAKYADLHKNYDIYVDIVRDLNTWLYEQRDMHRLKERFNNQLGVVSRSYKVFTKKAFLIYVLRKEMRKGAVEAHPNLWGLLQKKSRNISGITNVTVLTSPFPDGQKFSCRHNCYYCPNEPAHEGNKWQAQPRSYLYEEPAVHRANTHKFDAYDQVTDRLGSLLMMGMEIDKLEIIIEGGTYTEYPTEYLKRFHRDLFYAANVFFSETKRERLSLQAEMQINITAQVRIIGICIETRPDVISDDWIRFFRYTGTTRVQMGVQHLRDDILDLINRGHTLKQAVDTMRRLKDNCFKVDIHIMPDLPGSSPAADMLMFDQLFKTDILQPDQVKIYPCSVVPWTIIEKWHKSGKYVPYGGSERGGSQKLTLVIKYAMMITPPWIRLPRVIRDIPVGYISGGCQRPDMRDVINKSFDTDKFMCQDIRAREIGRKPEYATQTPHLVVRSYRASGADEYFVSFESRDKVALFGFIRLRIPQRDHMPAFKCLRDKGLVRELHVYGNVTPVGQSADNTQHRGLGQKLLYAAETIAKREGVSGLAVISGVGVMGYYQKLGFYYNDTFMVKLWVQWWVVRWWARLLLFWLWWRS